MAQCSLEYALTGAVGYASVPRAGEFTFFSPGGLVGFWDAFDATTVTRDGSDRVESWADKSGYGHDLLQSTDLNKPLYSATALDASLPGLIGRHDGSNNSRMEAIYSPALDFSGGMHMFTLAQRSVDMGTIEVVAGQQDDAAVNFYQGISTGDRGLLTTVGSGFILTEHGATVGLGTPFILEACFDGDSTVMVNVNDGTAVSASNDIKADGVNFAIFSYLATANNPFAGVISRMVLYNRALTPGERAAAYSLLSNGITLA